MSLHDACQALIAAWREQADAGEGPGRSEDGMRLCAEQLAAALRAQQPTGPVCLDCGREYQTGHKCEKTK